MENVSKDYIFILITNLEFKNELQMMSTEKGLTNLQLEILKIFNYELPDNQLIEIKGLLSKYFADQASNEMDRLWEENGWDDKTMDDWTNEDLRKKDE